MNDAVLEMLPLLHKGGKICRLCCAGLPWNRQIIVWLNEGKSQLKIADLLTEGGIKCDDALVGRHKKHLLKAAKEAAAGKNGHYDDVQRLQVELQIEKEKRLRLEVAHNREERIRAALDALRDEVPPAKMSRIEEILKG